MTTIHGPSARAPGTLCGKGVTETISTRPHDVTCPACMACQVRDVVHLAADSWSRTRCGAADSSAIAVTLEDYTCRACSEALARQ